MEEIVDEGKNDAKHKTMSENTFLNENKQKTQFTALLFLRS